MNTRTVVLSLILVLFHAMLSAAEPPPEAEPFSPANTLLFRSNHLAKLTAPARLIYDFRKTGSVEEGFSDTVELALVAAQPENAGRIEVTFFSGERARPVPELTVAEGNPIVMLFLQREVNELGRLSGGSWRHFQKQIKLALENEAEVTPLTVPLQGEEVPATRITITPYRNDPQRRQFEAFAETRYEFTLSDQVPGFVYEMRAVTPGKASNPAQAEAQPLRDEALTFRRLAG